MFSGLTLSSSEVDSPALSSNLKAKPYCLRWSHSLIYLLLGVVPFFYLFPIFIRKDKRRKREEGKALSGGKYDTVPEKQDRAGWGCCSPYRTALLPPVLLLLHSDSLAPCCTREFDISNGTRLITSGFKSTRVTKNVPDNHAYCRPLFLLFSFSKPGGVQYPTS